MHSGQRQDFEEKPQRPVGEQQTSLQGEIGESGESGDTGESGELKKKRTVW